MFPKMLEQDRLRAGLVGGSRRLAPRRDHAGVPGDRSLPGGAPTNSPHVSLDEKTRNDIAIDRLEKAKSEGGNAFHAGIEALNNSPVPFC